MHVNNKKQGIFTTFEKDPHVCDYCRYERRTICSVDTALCTRPLCGCQLYQTPAFAQSLLLNTTSLTKVCKTPCFDRPVTTAPGFGIAFVSPGNGNKENQMVLAQKIVKMNISED